MAQSWSRHESSEAQAAVLRSCAQEDPLDCGWLWDEDATERTDLGYSLHSATGQEDRYEWPDGSVIVVGNTWNYGVHRDLIDQAAARIADLPEASRAARLDARFIWPDPYSAELGEPPAAET